LTRYAAWPSWAAKIALVLAAALIIYGSIGNPTPAGHFGRPPEWRDWMLYHLIVDHMIHGEGYYAAAAAEHRLHLYPTTPPQVFREPTLAWILAELRTDTARTLSVAALSILTLLAMERALARTDMNCVQKYSALLLVACTLVLAWAPMSAYTHEVWAGLLLALSLACYRLDCWRISILLGVAACLIRELSLPYLIIMAGFSLWERKRRELGGWIAGIALFGVFFTAHLMMASRLSQPDDLAFRSVGWIYFGGWPFVVQTARMNLILLYAPKGIVAAATCLSVIGLTGARDPWLCRIAVVVCSYLAAFMFVGLPGNTYWGLLYAPMLPIGFVLSPASLRDLASRAVPSLSKWISAPAGSQVHS
jgi:hypothetical protein